MGLQKTFAYLGRYAHQQRSEIRAMPWRTMQAWVDGVEDIVKRENER